MSDAPIIRVVLQRHPSDCGVAALAMICGVTYEEALIAMAASEPEVLTRGVYTKHIEEAAARLGYKLRRRRSYDMENDTGLLNMSSRRWSADHIAVLREGLILETDGTVWEAVTYFSANRAKPGTLLTFEALNE